MDKKPSKDTKPKSSLLGTGMVRQAADAVNASKEKREQAAGLKAGGKVKRGYGAARCR